MLFTCRCNWKIQVQTLCCCCCCCFFSSGNIKNIFLLYDYALYVQNKAFNKSDTLWQALTLSFKNINFCSVCSSHMVVMPLLNILSVLDCNVCMFLLLLFTAQCTLVHMRGLGIACRLSVCLSVCNVGGLWSHRLEILETNCTDN